MRTITIDVTGIKNVREAIKQAQLTAEAKDAQVCFEFNGVVVRVVKTDKFNDVLKMYLKDSNDLQMRNEKIKAVTPVVSDLKASENQLKLNALVGQVANHMVTSKTVLDFLETYTKYASNVDVQEIHSKRVYDELLSHGFYENMLSGDKSAWNDAVKSSAFIVGKAMGHLAKCEVPHPVLHSFIEHWRELFAKHTQPPKG